jgi:hypothetical protein
MKRQGYVRVEVQVDKEDTALVHTIASALADPAHAAGSPGASQEVIC